MFGSKEPKPLKPVPERACPFGYAFVSDMMDGACTQARCALWQDELQACAFNVIAKELSAR